MSNLTDRQKEVLLYIQDRTNWRLPSYRTIAKAMGVTDVGDIVRTLIREGYLERDGKGKLLLKKELHK